jgi:uncharacterized membrane protein
MTCPSGWSPEPIDESEAESSATQEPLPDMLRRLIANARAYGQAESQRQKLRAAFIAGNVRDAAIAGIIALFLLFAVSVALLIGLVMALAPVIGIWWALALVILGGLLCVAAIGLFALSRIKRLSRKQRT